MKRSGAGSLDKRVAFQRRNEVDDGYGNSTADWTEQFAVSARLTPKLTGSEQVEAGRMEGEQPYILRVRSSSQTRQVTEAWRAYDKRAGIGDNGEPRRVFHIRSLANLDERGQYIDFLVTEGRVN